jgi:hypothetical protein
LLLLLAKEKKGGKVHSRYSCFFGLLLLLLILLLLLLLLLLLRLLLLRLLPLLLAVEHGQPCNRAIENACIGEIRGQRRR